MIIVKQYTCSSCGFTEEVFHRREEAPSSVCSQCGEAAVEPELCAPSFKLEGLTGAFPSAYDRWANDHESMAKRARAKNREAREHRAKEEANV